MQQDSKSYVNEKQQEKKIAIYQYFSNSGVSQTVYKWYLRWCLVNRTPGHSPPSSRTSNTTQQMAVGGSAGRTLLHILGVQKTSPVHSEPLTSVC